MSTSHFSSPNPNFILCPDFSLALILIYGRRNDNLMLETKPLSLSLHYNYTICGETEGLAMTVLEVFPRGAQLWGKYFSLILLSRVCGCTVYAFGEHSMCRSSGSHACRGHVPTGHSMYYIYMYIYRDHVFPLLKTCSAELQELISVHYRLWPKPTPSLCPHSSYLGINIEMSVCAQIHHCDQKLHTMRGCGQEVTMETFT